MLCMQVPPTPRALCWRRCECLQLQAGLFRCLQQGCSDRHHMDGCTLQQQSWRNMAEPCSWQESARSMQAAVLRQSLAPSMYPWRQSSGYSTPKQCICQYLLTAILRRSTPTHSPHHTRCTHCLCPAVALRPSSPTLLSVSAPVCS